jgi:pimeloyl-ACP methyl ester carboxylesterase
VLWLIHALGDSSQAFGRLFETDLARDFELQAPDWPGAGAATGRPIEDLAGIAVWLAESVERLTPGVPIGLAGHSLGAAVAVKAAQGIPRTVGLFSIEGNLTGADVYFSGLAAEFEDAEEFRRHLIARIGQLADRAAPGRRESLVRYRLALERADARTLWALGRAARTASLQDALGEEYRALPVPTLYLWSPENTPSETQAFIREHGLANLAIPGGHWPMIEQPELTSRRMRAFFEPLFARAVGAGPR